MHMARHMEKTLIFASVEMSVFCLLRLCPNPRRTLVVCSGNAEKIQRLHDFQIAKGNILNKTILLCFLPV